MALRGEASEASEGTYVDPAGLTRQVVFATEAGVCVRNKEKYTHNDSLCFCDETRREFFGKMCQNKDGKKCGGLALACLVRRAGDVKLS